jgi:3-hydroxyisobutyrate dehydrogenase-like beta-hydroxyacid dehydrogenase
LLGDKGLLAKMRKGATYIDVSTIDPGTARTLSDAAEAKGIDFLECPLGKTPAHAEKAEEPIFAGGKKAVYEKMLETLTIIGKPFYYLGEVEAACAGMTKLDIFNSHDMIHRARFRMPDGHGRAKVGRCNS